MKESYNCNGCVHCNKHSLHVEPCLYCCRNIINVNSNVDEYEPESSSIYEHEDGQMTFVDHAEDVVNHPFHYCQDGGMECIDEMIAVFGKTAVKHFCLLNVWKYRKRALFKNETEDMKKSDWYMKKYVELGGKAVNC